MDSTTISQDNCCQLGKWLYEESKSKHNSAPEFRTLVEKHKAFHAEAGKIAHLINGRKFAEAERALAAETGYAVASGAVVTAIRHLKAAISTATPTRHGPVGRMQAAVATAFQDDPDWKEF